MKSERIARTLLNATDQQLRVPVSPANESLILSFQVPLAEVPDLPLNLASGCSGRKLPTKGADPWAIKLGAESSKVVLELSGAQALP